MLKIRSPFLSFLWASSLCGACHGPAPAPAAVQQQASSQPPAPESRDTNAQAFVDSADARSRFLSAQDTANEWLPRLMRWTQRSGGSPTPDVIVFQNGRVLNTGIYETRFIGFLRGPGSVPYLILGGFDCTDCDAERDAFVVSPIGGPVRDSQPKIGYLAPGAAWSEDPSDTVPGLVARMFTGRCLPAVPLGVVWYSSVQVDSSTRQQRVRVIASHGAGLDTLDTLQLPGQLDTTLRLVTEGACREVTPEDAASLRPPR